MIVVKKETDTNTLGTRDKIQLLDPGWIRNSIKDVIQGVVKSSLEVRGRLKKQKNTKHSKTEKGR